MEDADPRITEHYGDLADVWDEVVDQPGRTQLLWPTVDSLLPDVEGRRVLDAGCGSGVYAGVLADRGADVVGVDASEEMVRAARDAVDDASFRVADLREPLDFLAPGSVDVVLC